MLKAIISVVKLLINFCVKYLFIFVLLNLLCRTYNHTEQSKERKRQINDDMVVICNFNVETCMKSCSKEIRSQAS